MHESFTHKWGMSHIKESSHTERGMGVEWQGALQWCQCQDRAWHAHGRLGPQRFLLRVFCSVLQCGDGARHVHGCLGAQRFLFRLCCSALQVLLVVNIERGMRTLVVRRNGVYFVYDAVWCIGVQWVAVSCSAELERGTRMLVLRPDIFYFVGVCTCCSSTRVLQRDNRARPCVLQCVAGCCSVVMEYGVRMLVLKPNGIYFVNSLCSASKGVAGWWQSKDMPMFVFGSAQFVLCVDGFRVAVLSLHEKWLVHTCAMSYSRVPWLIHMCHDSWIYGAAIVFCW